MTRISGLTGATIETAPTVCHECIWWQTRDERSIDKRKWIRDAEDEWGAWGTVYHDDDGRLLGSMQYGPADLFPRARELPAGPASDDAVLARHAHSVLPRQRTVCEPSHSVDFLRRVRGVTGEDLGRDRRLTGHRSQRSAVLSTSSVASGRAAKRKGTNVVPSPAETCIVAAALR